jgi:hypothetical protein
MNKLDEESDACMKMYDSLHKAYVEAIKATEEAYSAYMAADDTEANAEAIKALVEAQKRERDAYTFWSTFRI